MIRALILLTLTGIILQSCSVGNKKSPQENEITIMDTVERYRPVFHFTPERNWINDPNGLVYHDGEYHLFYQYNPYGDTWGHMSWGHAISEDLVTWEHLPVALYEEEGIMIFSGSAVMDKGNTTGLCRDGNDCMVAIYTSHIADSAQHQSIAYSSDKGRTWTKFGGNPVLDIGMKDFRDPRVFWYAPEEKWVMVVSLPLEYKVYFYQSKDLLEWEKTGEFGGLGDVSKIWECPDLSRVRVEGSGEYKWVLIISSGSKYGDYTGMQYFIGDFDGTTFMPDNPSGQPHWLDHGKDFYAAITYNNLPESRDPILVGWINNWRYAGTIPTSPWRGMMSAPRSLSIIRENGKYVLLQKPVKGIVDIFDEPAVPHYEDQRISDANDLLRGIQAESFRVKLELENIDSDEFGLEVFRGEEVQTLIGYNVSDHRLFVDRRQSGNVKFHDAFPSVDYAEVTMEKGILEMDIFVDQSVIEVFANGGRTVLTEQVFPPSEANGLRLRVRDGEVRLRELSMWKIR